MRKLHITVILALFAVFSMQSQNCEDLLIAVKENDMETVSKLLEKVRPNCWYDSIVQPRTPLGLSAMNGNLKIGKALVNAGAKVSYRHPNDASALMIAAQNGYYEFSKFLIDSLNKLLARFLHKKI